MPLIILSMGFSKKVECRNEYYTINSSLIWNGAKRTKEKRHTLQTKWYQRIWAKDSCYVVNSFVGWFSHKRTTLMYTYLLNVNAVHSTTSTVHSFLQTITKKRESFLDLYSSNTIILRGTRHDHFLHLRKRSSSLY